MHVACELPIVQRVEMKWQKYDGNTCDGLQQKVPKSTSYLYLI